MKKLHINFINNLQNNEFAKLYEQLCTTIDQEQIIDYHAQRAYKQIKNHVNEIAYISDDSRRSHLTKIIGEQVCNRTDYLMSLSMQVKGLKLSFCEEERAAALVLSNWLHQQGKNLYTPTINTQTRLVNNLMHVRSLNSELEEAIIFLRLDRHIAAIDGINKEINANFMRRIKEMSAKSKKSKAIRKAAYRDLKIFISVINLLVDIDYETKENTIYQQYSREISNLLTYYHTKLKSRTTKNKNRKEVTAAVNELIKIQQNPQKALPMEAKGKLTTNPQNKVNDEKYSSSNPSKTNPNNKLIDGEDKRDSLLN